jgi:hypothetical protein
MSPEESLAQQEHETRFEINTGDVVFVSRNLKNEDGTPQLDAEGKQSKALEDGWEVVDMTAINPTNGREGIMLRNTNDPDELKFYSFNQLADIQSRAEHEIINRASSVASDMIKETGQISNESTEYETSSRDEAVEDLAEVAVEQVVSEPPIEGQPSDWSREAAEAQRSSPTKDKPHMFGIEDRVELTTIQLGGREVRAMTTGWYVDESGQTQMLLGPVNVDDMDLFKGREVTQSLAARHNANKQPAASAIIDRVPVAQPKVPSVEQYATQPREGEINGDAMTMEEFQALIAEQRGNKVEESGYDSSMGTTTASLVEAPQETQLDMYKRFARELKAELDDLYSQRRKAQPGSDEAYALENQIKGAKEDAGKYARMVAKLQGNTNWH